MRYVDADESENRDAAVFGSGVAAGWQQTSKVESMKP
jgi:hypothetical protein